MIPKPLKCCCGACLLFTTRFLNSLKEWTGTYCDKNSKQIQEIEALAQVDSYAFDKIVNFFHKGDDLYN